MPNVPSYELVKERFDNIESKMITNMIMFNTSDPIFEIDPLGPELGYESYTGIHADSNGMITLHANQLYFIHDKLFMNSYTGTRIDLATKYIKDGSSYKRSYHKVEVGEIKHNLKNSIRIGNYENAVYEVDMYPHAVPYDTPVKCKITCDDEGNALLTNTNSFKYYDTHAGVYVKDIDWINMRRVA